MSATHTATVTFLFTDIEGSTRRWQDHPDGMREALERHDEMVADIVNDHTGTVFKNTGDGAAAVFPTSSDAVLAAADLQLALDVEDWGEVGQIRARMGVHTGEADERDGDYFGAALSRAARLMDADHAGQIVASATAAEMMQGRMPDGYSLGDLGEHRFKDLGRRQRVHQLEGPGLELSFGPLRSLDSHANNLPGQRPHSWAETVSSQKSSASSTKAGWSRSPGLAAWARPGSPFRRRPSVSTPTTACGLVELAPITDAGLIPREVAAAVGVAEEASRTLMETLLDHLGDSATLFVHDNCEHVIDEAAKFVEEVLRGAPNVRILATSREGLAIGGERLWRVPSLGTRHTGFRDAATLFTDRARLVRPDIEFDTEVDAAIEQICRRLDGIPLAIELATARLKVLSPSQIAERIDDRFRLLTGGSRTALPRQRTLQATMDWSHDLLNDHEQALLRRLSVFYGGFTFEAAEEVCHGDVVARLDVLDLLTRLVESSLVLVAEGTQARYQLLETVRQYGLDRLTAAGEADDARRRHARYFHGAFEHAETDLLGTQNQETMDRLEAEHDNLRAALTWSFEAGENALGQELVSRISRFWFFGSYFAEGRHWTDTAVREGPSEPTASRADILSWAAAFALWQGEPADAADLSGQALAVAQAAGDRRAEARSRVTVGNVQLVRGALEEAAELYERTLAWARVEDPGYAQVPLVNLGMVNVLRGDTAAASTAIDELLGLATEFRNPELIGWALVVTAWIVHHDGEPEEAIDAYQEALAHVRASEQGVLEAWSVIGLADALRVAGRLDEASTEVHRALQVGREIGATSADWLAQRVLCRITYAHGDLAAAAEAYGDLLDIARRYGDQESLARAIDDLGLMIVERAGDLDLATTLLSYADHHRATRGRLLPARDQEELDGAITLLRTRIPDSFAGSWAAGEGLDQIGAHEIARRAIGHARDIRP